MKYCIVVSEKDLAGMNIFDKLLKSYDFKKQEDYHILDNVLLVKIEEDTVSTDNLDKKIDADIFIFATRHSSSRGVKSLSIHVPGNWGTAEFGGTSRRLCIAPASYIKEGLKVLDELVDDDSFEVTVEQTHHGPIMEKPCFFIEIGSNEEQWQDKKAGELLAKAIMMIIKNKPSYKAAVFLGGGHYNRVVNKVLLTTEYAVGHICAKHSLDCLDEDMLEQSIERTSEVVELVMLDWKGLGQNKRRIVEMLDKLEIRYERSKRIIKK